nr:MAG TPA: hypothetical protein [Caudoviricetes sp.]
MPLLTGGVQVRRLLNGRSKYKKRAIHQRRTALYSNQLREEHHTTLLYLIF